MVNNQVINNIGRVIRMNFDDKVHILRTFERYIYQITVHHLKDNEEAIEACKRGLIKIFHTEEFFHLTDDLKQYKLRSVMLMECAMAERRRRQAKGTETIQNQT